MTVGVTEERVPEREMANGTEIVLVHGLWFGSWSMGMLGRHLRRAGFRTRRFSYSTTHQSMEHQADELYRFALRSDETLPHFVCHSMGGLVTLNMLCRHPDTPAGRVVLMGSPLKGSKVAGRFSHWPGGRVLLGTAMSTLIEGVQCWPEGREIAMIAGTRSLGLGLLAGGAGNHGDGTVLSDETRHEALADYIEMPVSHTSMLFSKLTARQDACFIRTGRFEQGS